MTSLQSIFQIIWIKLCFPTQWISLGLATPIWFVNREHCLYSDSLPAGRSRDRIPPVANRSKVDRLLGLRVRIPPGAWMFVLCVVSKDKKVKCRKCRTKKTQNQVRAKYDRVQENKKIPVKASFSAPIRTGPAPPPPPSFLYNGYRVSFPGVKRPWRGVNHPPYLGPRLKKE